MSNALPVYTPPPKETAATVRDVINVNLALSEVLAEESRLMETMQIQQVGELQDRKLRLTNLMERYTRYLSQHPEILATITLQERYDLQKAGEIFRSVVRKNYDKLLVARAVNGAVVQCVTGELAKASHNPVYNASGNVKGAYRTSLSMTLNQTI
jgi:hypothetical protein